MDVYEFNDSLVYTETIRLARARQSDCFKMNSWISILANSKQSLGNPSSVTFFKESGNRYIIYSYLLYYKSIQFIDVKIRFQ